MRATEATEISLAKRHLVLSLLFLLIASSLVSAGFTRSFLSVKISLNDDGSANVREELRFTIDDAYSVDSYSTWVKSANDLSGWRARTKLDDIRYHLGGTEVSIKNPRLQPSGPDTCNYEKTKCYGTFVIEYQIDAPTGANDSKWLVWIEKYNKPRTISYTFNKEAFSFETTYSGEKYLPELTSLEITLPDSSQNIVAEPKPVEYTDKIPDNTNMLTWQGYITLKNFNLKFDTKESLSSEVSYFFDSLKNTAVGWLTSKEGMIITAAVIIIFASYLILQRRKTE
jgi:hypothetical protein